MELKVTDVLPHRTPFLFVDEILEFSYLKYAKGKKKIGDNEFWVPGHFPGNPIFPGVLTLETMAQVGGFIFVNEMKQTKSEKFTYLSKVDVLKLKRKIVPGDTLIIEAKFLESILKYASVYVKAYVNEKIVAEAQITYTFLDEL